MQHTRYLVLSLLAIAACNTGAGDDASQAPPGQPSTAEQVAATPSSDPWAVSSSGVGTVKFGATLADIAPLLAPDTDTVALAEGCAYIHIPDAPAGLGFMLEDGRVVRVDVDSGVTPTREGARIGDGEQRLDSLYGLLRRMPHKYSDGWFYLVAIPGAPADTLGRIVFESDGARVRAYRAGLYPAVEYVERCG